MHQLKRHCCSKPQQKATLRYLLFYFAVGFITLSSYGFAQSTDKGFNPQTNDLVRAVKVLHNGKILVGGDFTTVGDDTSQAYLALFHVNGTIDQQFSPVLDGQVFGLAEQPDGKLLVYGVFNTVNGLTQQRLVRLNLNGSIDPTFAHDINDPIHAIALKNNGQLLVAAGFGQTRLLLLDSNGTTTEQLATFNDPGGNPRVNAIVIQDNQKILLGGQFSQVNGIQINNLARISSNGVVDMNFSSPIQPNGLVTDMTLQADGDILIAGEFTQISGQNQAHLARIYSSGTYDTGFEPQINAPVDKVSITADGRIAMAGAFTEINGNTNPGHRRFAILAADGDLDTSFNPLFPPNQPILDFDWQSDGGIVAGGAFTSFSNLPRLHLARYNKNGRIDQAFTGEGVESGASIYALAQNSNNQLLLGGNFSEFGTQPVSSFSWLLPTGNAASSPVPVETDGDIFSILQLPDDKVLIAGDFSSVNGQPHANIVRFNSGFGGIDQNFQASTDGPIYAMHPYTNGRILLAGDFGQTNIQTRDNIALINSNGSLVQDFAPEVNFPIRTLAVDDTNRILIGGSFQEVNGFNRKRLARFIMVGDTPFVDTFDPAPDNTVYSMAFDQKRNLLVGGLFKTMAGQSRQGLARFNSSDNLDNLDLPLNTSGSISGIAAQKDGCIYIAGSFVTVAGFDRQNTSKICPDQNDLMVVDPDFIYQTSGTVTGLMLQEDGKLVLGGKFNTANSIYAGGLSRLSNEQATIQTLGLTHNKIRWYNDQSMPIPATPPGWSISINGGPTIDMGAMQLSRGQWEAPLPPIVAEQAMLDITINRYHSSGQYNGSGVFYQSKYRRQYHRDLIFENGFE